MVNQIYLVDDTLELMGIANRIFSGEDNLEFIHTRCEDIDKAIQCIPELFIINDEKTELETKEIARRIRENEDNSITPIIVVSDEKDKKHRIDILKLQVEYYIPKPIEDEYFYFTIKNLLRLLTINRTISPLTGLPGNVQIEAELKKRIKQNKKFAVLYLDLDNFKAYNDTYGFVKGDDIIKFTADVIYKNVMKFEGEENFVGHIGGDDFVAIADIEHFEEMCQDIIIEFNENILNFFTDEDRYRGYIEVENRKRQMEQFPLTSLSIGVTTNNYKKFKSVLHVGELATEVKNKAKMIPGSTYYIDQRKK